MKTNNEQLTLQQQRFCDEYLVSFNAFQSALKAGYSEHTARKCELLHLPKVQTYLQAGMKRTSERLEISHDMILRELAKVAFANMGDYYDENAVLKPMNELTPDQKAAICHYQLIDCVGEYGERAGELSKIKLHNKMSALDKIARHTGFYLVKKQEAGGRKQEAENQKEEEVLSRAAGSPEVDGAVLDMVTDEHGAEALQTLTHVKHSLQTSASVGVLEEESRTENQESREGNTNNGGKRESRIENQESREDGFDEKVLTLSHLEEEARCKNQDTRHVMGCENRTLSPLSDAEKLFGVALDPKCCAMTI